MAKGNIERLAALRDKHGANTEIIWNFLVFSFNEHEIEVAEAFCKDIGIKFGRREAFIQDPSWLPSYRKPKPAWHTSPPQRTQDEKPQGKNRKPCAWHYGYSIVNANGSVSPCCAPWQQESDFGQIKVGETTFSDIWNNHFLRKSRSVFLNKAETDLDDLQTLCMSCPFDDNFREHYAELETQIVEQLVKVFNVRLPAIQDCGAPAITEIESKKLDSDTLNTRSTFLLNLLSRLGLR